MVVTDPTSPNGLEAAVAEALRAGAPAIQLRHKQATTRQLLALASDLRSATREAGALLLINDRLDVALAVGADGAHLGDADLPLEAARRIAPAGFLLGRSVDTPGEVVAAERAGADYVGLGPIHSTATKRDTGPVVGVRGLRAARARTALPIVAIGGITSATAGDMIRAGADGVAVIGAVMAATDPYLATRALLEEIARASSSIEGGQ
jgi:thiamine-phosphate pyrophosphorylase